MIRKLTLLAVAIGMTTYLAADIKTEYPLWDGGETQAQYAEHAGIDTAELVLDLGDGVTIKLVLIPAGKFMMGDPDSTKRAMTIAETPQHEVTLTKPFFMGVTEVTQAQYEAVMGKSGNMKKNETMDKANALAIHAGEITDYEKDPDMPVDYVDWHQAMAFCEALSARIGRTVTLPTEAQWEFAYSAGTTSDFYWGNTKDPGNSVRAQEYAWFHNNTPGGDTRGAWRVAQKKPNAWGLYDMAGNVLEFTLDYGRIYTEEPQIDPVGPVKAGMRGGYCGNHLEWLTRYHRKGGNTTYKMDVINRWKERFPCQGFRVIIPVE